MNEIIEILMDRDEMTRKEAKSIVLEARKRIEEGEDPEELLLEIGLEIDYIFDLLD